MSTSNMMQHSVANYVNINDYDYDKQIKQKNKDIAAIQAQINALAGVTGDSVKARRAKLQAELQEKQEDLEDTRFDHLIDTQQQGFDKLSKDMQEALDNAIELINGDQKVLQEVSNAMLQQLISNGIDEGQLLNDLKETHGTVVSDSTQQIINTLTNGTVNISTDNINTVINEQTQQIINALKPGNNGISDMVHTATTNISEAIANAIPATQITSIAGDVAIQNSKLEAIEKAIRDNAAEKTLEDEALKVAKANMDAANNVINLIDQIGDVSYDAASRTRIDNAQNAFNNLNDAQKGLVSNKGRLEEAQGIYARYDQEARNRAESERAAAAAAREARKNELQSQITAQNNLLADLDRRIELVSRFVTRGASQSEARKEVQPVLNDLEQKAKTARFKQREEIMRQISRIQNYPEEYIYDHVKQYQNELKDLKARRAAALSNIQQLQTQLQSLATGTKRFGKNGFAWTNENLQNGPELIVRPSDGAILTPLKANDAVIPANLANNLFKWGAINPDSFAINPFMGKWGDVANGKGSDMFSNNTTNQSIDVHFDSLITVQGNVDADVVNRLEDIGKNLANNKDFQKNVIKFVTKDFVKESRKLGLR